jgi:hypothetical protein
MGHTLNNSLFSDAASAATDSATAQQDTAQAQAQSGQQQSAAAQTTAAADLLQGSGDILEGHAYGAAASLATLNAQYTTASTAIQEPQGQRQIYQTIGGIKASVAGSGLTEGGTAGDILASSAQQGALSQAVTASQGQIQVAGYQEQAQSYTAMQSAAMLSSQAQTQAAAGEQDVASGYQDVASGYQAAATGADVAGGIMTAGATASIISWIVGVLTPAGTTPAFSVV